MAVVSPSFAHIQEEMLFLSKATMSSPRYYLSFLPHVFKLFVLCLFFFYKETYFLHLKAKLKQIDHLKNSVYYPFYGFCLSLLP